MSSGLVFAASSARSAAATARSDEACSGAAIRRSRIPVRSRIHSSLVSTMRSKSALVSTRSGTYIPVPAMVAPRMASGRADVVGKDLLPNVLVHALVDETGQRADRAAERLGLARPVADEAHTIDPEERRGPVLLPVDLGLEPAQRRQHEQRAGAREQVAIELLAHLVREQSGDALGGLQHDVA